MTDKQPDQSENSNTGHTEQKVPMSYHIPPPVYSVGGMIVVRMLSDAERLAELRAIRKELAHYFTDDCQFLYTTRAGADAVCTVKVTSDRPGFRKVNITVNKEKIPGRYASYEPDIDWRWSAYHDLRAIIIHGKGLPSDKEAQQAAREVIERCMSSSRRAINQMGSSSTAGAVSIQTKNDGDKAVYRQYSMEHRPSGEKQMRRREVGGHTDRNAKKPVSIFAAILSFFSLRK